MRILTLVYTLRFSIYAIPPKYTLLYIIIYNAGSHSPVCFRIKRDKPHTIFRKNQKHIMKKYI